MDTVKNIMDRVPLAMEHETDARDVWPRRYELLAEKYRVQEKALMETAEIAHEGGLRNLSEGDALIEIRKITTPWILKKPNYLESYDLEEGECNHE